MRRGLRLIPTLLASGLLAMTQVGPSEAEANLCHWLNLVGSANPDSCLQGMPEWVLYLIVSAGFFGGLLWFFWPNIFPAADLTRTTLEALGPRRHPRGDTRFYMWVIDIKNLGPVAAQNVVVRLRSVAPKPRYQLWAEGYPYIVERLGFGVLSHGSGINPGDDETFHILTGWPNNGDFYTKGLNTRGGDNPIKIERDEMWVLEYEVTAANADKIQFQVRVWLDADNRAVMAARN
jgi:hypothetical protein